MQSQIAPFVMVIFGVTGDLTARKLMPALYHLLLDGVLPKQFIVVGMARRPFTHDQFRELMHDAIAKFSHSKSVDPGIWQILSQNLFYEQGMFEEDGPYEKVIERLSGFDAKMGACITRFFYLATPPQNYSTILQKLATTKLSEGCGQGSKKWTRVLIEKPFGKDLETAKKLEEELAGTFEERQIYRIDHYLAKESIQNILAFRFANGIFEPLWNKDHIDHIQITLAESGGILNRGKLYEGMGALRDIAQNHLMAMLAYTAMEAPKDMNVETVRGERVKLLEAIRRMNYPGVEKDIVRGQYAPAEINDKMVAGYREEKDVESNSYTETYVAFKLFIDNPRWQGMPFYLRTGKRMPLSSARISIQFKRPLNSLFPTTHNTSTSLRLISGQALSVNSQPSLHTHDNVLTFRIQPREGISLQMYAKEPGFGYKLRNVKMDFSYESSFGKNSDDSYERLLIDCMTGDQTLFATGSGFNATWKLMTDIMKVWELQVPDFPNYEAGTWGPKDAADLIERDGRHWLLH